MLFANAECLVRPNMAGLPWKLEVHFPLPFQPVGNIEPLGAARSRQEETFHSFPHYSGTLLAPLNTSSPKGATTCFLHGRIS